MIVEELKNNKYLCISTDEEIYAPNHEVAVERCKKRRQSLVLTILQSIKNRAWNAGNRDLQSEVEEVIEHVKDMT
jgi:hypothetical protein